MVRNTLISSQLPVAKWYELFEDSTVADALMDRKLHQTIRIDLKGESLRKKSNTVISLCSLNLDLKGGSVSPE